MACSTQVRHKIPGNTEVNAVNTHLVHYFSWCNSSILGVLILLDATVRIPEPSGDSPDPRTTRRFRGLCLLVQVRGVRGCLSSVGPGALLRLCSCDMGEGGGLLIASGRCLPAGGWSEEIPGRGGVPKPQMGGWGHAHPSHGWAVRAIAPQSAPRDVSPSRPTGPA